MFAAETSFAHPFDLGPTGKYLLNLRLGDMVFGLDLVYDFIQPDEVSDLYPHGPMLSRSVFLKQLQYL